MTGQLDQAEAVFFDAIEKDSSQERGAFIQAACAGNSGLLRRVQELLAAHQEANGPLDRAAVEPVENPPSPTSELPGTMIGPYKLLEQIGEGGFGVVFMAEQQVPVRRKVALKIVKAGMDTRQVVARFEAERQALALMDHPNIAHVFDGGQTASGRPYFVMELVRGITITDFCDQNHLGIRERLELFDSVCSAVQHAHQKGIIHRDLKPTNIMVTLHDDRPVAKVIDFGIAKATGQQLTEKTLFTNYAQLIGTPMYMSPEQAQMSGLDIDTRTDVYSLGVLLYELLTGMTPFDKDRLKSVAYDEMRRIIREEEPIKPSTRMSTLGPAAMITSVDRTTNPKQLCQLLRGELDWIVMKALEKDRNRRYESVGSFAADVKRYLNDEPVLACPPTVGYRFQKLVRRNKVALATAAVVVAALSCGTGVAVWQAVVATQAATAEKKAKLVAEAKEAEALAVISFLENRVIAAVRPEGQNGGLGHDVSLRRAIEAAVPFVQEGFKDQPLIEARLRMTLGTSFGYLGEPKKSGDQRAAAREIYTKLLSPDHETTLRCSVALVTSYYEVGRFAEACQLCEATLGQLRVKLGPEHLLTLKAMDHLAVCYAGLGRKDDALKIREKALEIRKATIGPEHPHTVHCLHDLAVSYWELGRYSEALVTQEKVLAIRKVKPGPDHTDTLESMNNLGVTYESLGRFLDACTIHEEVLARRKVRIGIDHPFTLRTMHSLANCYLSLGRDADALNLLEEVLRLQKANRSFEHHDTLYAMHELAWCYRVSGRHDDAFKLGEETVTRRKTVLGADHPGTLSSMNNLGVYYSDRGQHAEALEVHKETLNLRTANLGAAHPQTLNSLGNVVRTLIKLERGADALPILDDGIKRALSVNDHSRFVGDMMILRMQHFISLKDVAGCRANAVMWETMGRTDAITLYNTACAHSVVAWMIHDLDPSAEAEKQSNAEADLAMDWLRKAVAAGFTDVAHMSNDADLEVLRNRPDFIKLMTELPAQPSKNDK